jgi:hypothetical protein
MRQPAGASQIHGATEDRDDHQDEHHHHQEPDHHGQLKQCPPGGRIRRPRFLGQGQAKEGLGRATDNQELQAEGQTDQTKTT